jgi:hypothetical protein
VLIGIKPFELIGEIFEADGIKWEVLVSQSGFAGSAAKRTSN